MDGKDQVREAKAYIYIYIYKLAAGVPIGAFSGSLSRVLVLESKYI